MLDKLDALQRQDTNHSEDSGQRQRNSRIPSLPKCLPWLLILAFALLSWLLFGERFQRGREVEAVQVITLRSQDAPVLGNSTDTAQQPEALDFDGPALFQASGWIESDPLPIRATTLYSGVIDTVYVLEGERVKSGQLLASMIAEDAELDLQTARAQLKEAKAEQLEAEAAVAAGEAAVETRKLEAEATESRLREFQDEAERLAQSGKEVFPESEITQSKLRFESQQSTMKATRSRIRQAEATLNRSKALLARTQASLESARAEVARKELALRRTRIYSPIGGRIQHLFASPGKKRMLAMDDLESATIATLYDPGALQARIDVPLEEAAQLRIGQPVRLRSTLLPDKIFEGKVTRIKGEADLQRNTLEAKIAIHNPNDQLRPEMLCRAEFITMGERQSSLGSQPSSPTERVSIFVPVSALVDFGDSVRAWVIDATGKHIELRDLELGKGRREQSVQVLEGLRPGDWVIDSPASDLEAGELISRRN